MRQLATLAFAQDEHGVVRIEIRTKVPLEDYRGPRSVVDEATGERRVVEHVIPLAKYFSRRGAIEPRSSKHADRSWRYLWVRSSGVVGGVSQPVLERVLDLSEGSEERRLLEIFVGQEQVEVVWVNEGVRAVHEIDPRVRSSWREGLDETQGISAAQWREEMQEWKWRHRANWNGEPRPRRHRRRTMAAPEPPVAFFAKRSGAIPRTGPVVVGGVSVPAGSRYPQGTEAAYWCTDAPLTDVAGVASALAGVFARTGLWPLLWRGGEDPDGYMGGHGDLDAIDHVDILELLQQRWDEHAKRLEPGVLDPFDAFPGLARATPAPTAGFDPFAAEMGGEPARLLSVPCNRPADAITALGDLSCGLDVASISAVLRSWEARFAATVVEVDPAMLILAIAAPTQDEEHALAIAAEMAAFGPPEELLRPGDLTALAGGLLGTPPRHWPTRSQPWRPDRWLITFE